MGWGKREAICFGVFYRVPFVSFRVARGTYIDTQPPTTILTICPPSLIRRVAHSSTVPISQPPHPSPVYSLCTRDVLFFFASFYGCCCCCCGWVVRRFFVCFRFFCVFSLAFFRLVVRTPAPRERPGSDSRTTGG